MQEKFYTWLNDVFFSQEMNKMETWMLLASIIKLIAFRNTPRWAEKSAQNATSPLEGGALSGVTA